MRELLTAKISQAQRSVLEQTTVDNHSPGPLLANINTLIDAIGAGMQTTSAYFALPQRVLKELNDSLVEPLPHQLKRPQLRSFPTLMGLFVLLRGTGLAVGETKPKRVVLIDPAMKEQWQALNPTEQYFALMASWFYESSLDCVGIQSGGVAGMLRETRDAYFRLDDRITRPTSDRFGMRTEPSVANALLHQFGWIRLTHDTKAQPGKAANVCEVVRSPLGDAMFVVNCQFGAFEDENEPTMQTKMQKYFPDWKQVLTQPTAECRQGAHTFKVSLGKIWRRIVAPTDANLEQLADAILHAYQFNHEHLYEFELRDTRGRSLSVAGPHIREAEHFADEMRVGDVPLSIGDSMVFHYDFGDDWRFNVTLESIDESDTGKTKTLKVTAESGTAPTQYDQGDW